MKHTNEDLKIMQAWSLERKIRVTQTRIIEYYQRFKGKVYISFSGGKDSTVLLDLARRCYPELKAVFCDTGLEYPEIREFVKTYDNVNWIKPLLYNRKKRKYVETNFKEIIQKYGYPIISKEVSQAIQQARKPGNLSSKQKFNDNSDYVKKYGRRFSLSKWNFIKNSDILISDFCCNAMKKNPAKIYERETGEHCIVATMACESVLRKTEWLKSSCNSFGGRPMSKPMSFWTEQDVLRYLTLFNIPLAPCYGKIIEYKGKLRTSILQRTGCMYCMFGVHREKTPNRFQIMAVTHPKQHDYCMRPIEENGLGIGNILDFIGVPYTIKSILDELLKE